jgi:predicted site-specific integrase-resolvase
MAGDTSKKALLRRGEVMEWLGLADHEMTAWVKEGVLIPRYLRKGARAFFVRKDIEKILEGQVVTS